MLDLMFGAALLALFAAPMLAIALAVRLDSDGPALVRQRAFGLNTRVFALLKFRTKRQDAAATRFGAWLHRTRLDDLPQLINVLRGEMSLIGPRPHAMDAAVAGRGLSQLVREYAHRHRVKPGIIGWAHVHGEHGPLKSAATARRRMKLDLDYASGASLWLDLQILARAVLDQRAPRSSR
jgi:lipopolysaccharide/colanic/teichoic acid biosynthesis glycosyltransferase